MTQEYKFEYLTGRVSLKIQNEQPDGIVVHIFNNSEVIEHSRIFIYGSSLVSPIVDSENLILNSNSHSGIGTTIPESGEYYVRIQTTSEFIVPTVSFDRINNSEWVSIVHYLPNDFAVFQMQPTKKRLW